MIKKGGKATVPANDGQTGIVSFWDALKAEGFVPARVTKRVIAEGYPEVPLTRYKPGKRVNE